MAKEKILIAVKTYPVLSKKYIELVCTAGFRSDGSWIRIYPSPFRFLQSDRRYKKYQWVEMDIKKNSKDHRPESYVPRDIDNIDLGEIISTKNAWKERRDFILGKNIIYKELAKIIEGAKKNKFSLVVFKPARILDFIIEPTSREWDQNKEQVAQAALKQGSLFDENRNRDFNLMPKLPYKFSYHFEDDTGRKSKLMIEDWETGQLYWNCLKRHKDEEIAKQKVKEKYLDDFAKKKDLYLFLGTTKAWHGRAPNPYIIIGTFHPPYST